MTFQSSLSLPPGYVTFCPVDLDAFEIPKESFYKYPINIQSFKVLSLPAISGNGRKDSLPVETL